MKSVTYEGHPVATRTGAWCVACGEFAAVSVEVAIVASDTLEILRRVTASTCAACGAED
jgi:hypothetical protein